MTDAEALERELRAYADAASPVWLEAMLRRAADALEAQAKRVEELERDRERLEYMMTRHIGYCGNMNGDRWLEYDGRRFDNGRAAIDDARKAKP